MSKNLHMSFAAMMHLAEELCLSALHTLKVKNPNSVHDGMAIDFALENINTK
jgi:hypothetical protein